MVKLKGTCQYCRLKSYIILNKEEREAFKQDSFVVLDNYKLARFIGIIFCSVDCTWLDL